MHFLRVTALFAVCFLWAQVVRAAPHGQTKEPGPALTPQEAMAKMELPPGFKVTLVASEPHIVNPTSFTFDDRGRIWITESIEYPRESSGPGQDRVKILEDVNHNGKFEKVTLYRDGLNIPCGIAIGNGGVYITNSPAILFLQGEDKAQKEEPILSGFGRADRHELPNSLTWGPDGWLYGMNGVFNGAHVENNGKLFDFTCAIWRWHPKTKKFELFAQGTSNPWGLDYNRQGDWFVSCCVIDHLFHMTQSGYYLRQGGPYPPQTHYLPSITTGRHQAAAYAGLCLYDAPQFPEEYRGTLLMGNLHGSALNRDTLTRNGATYVQHSAPDFVQANDAWFMPVSQKIGPDGCLYVMDWYDRYHCYQDAGRDPKGIDRERGRIYRISYGDPPAIPTFDLQKLSAQELIAQLSNPNVWWRRQAQRVLNEKFDAGLVPQLQKMALDTRNAPASMHALWLLVSQHQLDPAFHAKILDSADDPTRNWGVRGIGEMQEVLPPIYQKLKDLTTDPSPDVRVQVAVAAGRLTHPDGLPVLMAMLQNPENAKDPIIPTIIYNNIKTYIPLRGSEILNSMDKDPAIQSAFGNTVVHWVRDAVNALNRSPRQIVEDLQKSLPVSPDAFLKDPDKERRVRETLQSVADAFGSLGMKPAEAAGLFNADLRRKVGEIASSDYPSHLPATLIALWWDDPKAAEAARAIVSNDKADAATRNEFVRALGRERNPKDIDSFAALAFDNNAPILVRQNAVNVLGAMDNAKAAEALVARFDQAPSDLRPMIVNALVLSRASATALLDAMKSKKIALTNMNQNHAREINGLNDPDLTKQVAKVWGTVRTERNPERAKLVDEYKALFLAKGGEAAKGQKVFETKCAQCHTIYGHGGQIGPDITGVGRDNLDLVLSNVLDPNLVVGAPYYVHVARLKNGTVVSGLLVEESDKQVVLREPTGTIILPRDQIERFVQQNISMMPEGLESTMTKDEFCDLISFLLTKEPPQK